MPDRKTIPLHSPADAWPACNCREAVGAPTGRQARPDVDYPVQLGRPVKKHIHRVKRDQAQQYEPPQADHGKASEAEHARGRSRAVGEAEARDQRDNARSAQNGEDADRSLRLAPQFVYAVLAQQVAQRGPEDFLEAGYPQAYEGNEEARKQPPPHDFPGRTAGGARGTCGTQTKAANDQVDECAGNADKVMTSRHCQSLDLAAPERPERIEVDFAAQQRICTIAQYDGRPVGRRSVLQRNIRPGSRLALVPRAAYAQIHINQGIPAA